MPSVPSPSSISLPVNLCNPPPPVSARPPSQSPSIAHHSDSLAVLAHPLSQSATGLSLSAALPATLFDTSASSTTSLQPNDSLAAYFAAQIQSSPQFAAAFLQPNSQNLLSQSSFDPSINATTTLSSSASSCLGSSAAQQLLANSSIAAAKAAATAAMMAQSFSNPLLNAYLDFAHSSSASSTNQLASLQATALSAHALPATLQWMQALRQQMTNPLPPQQSSLSGSPASSSSLSSSSSSSSLTFSGMIFSLFVTIFFLIYVLRFWL